MTISKSLKSIANKSGITMVNAKFNFANQKLLSSMASSDKTQTSKSKNISKVVDQKADIARVSAPSTRATSLSSAAIATIKSPTKTPGAISADVQEKLKIRNTSLSPVAARLPMAPTNPIPGLLPAAGPPLVATSLPGVLPPVVVDSPTPEENEGGISVYSAIFDLEKSIFKPGSSLSSALSGDEKFSGKRPTEAEKPKVLAVIEESIKDGYPKSNSILFRKLKTNRGYATKYVIYRKDLFREFLFRKLAVLDPGTLIVPEQYKEFVVEQLQEQEVDVFVIRDSLIRNDAVYVYKIEVEWASTPVQPSTELFQSDTLTNLDTILPESIRRIQDALAGATPSTPAPMSPSATPTAPATGLSGLARRFF